uniref:Uncharacterized protein n=1 Tax=Glossina brevipalpis TaxID=37001 RepID=A0A1A9WGQ8_9MUSC
MKNVANNHLSAKISYRLHNRQGAITVGLDTVTIIGFFECDGKYPVRKTALKITWISAMGIFRGVYFIVAALRVVERFVESIALLDMVSLVVAFVVALRVVYSTAKSSIAYIHVAAVCQLTIMGFVLKAHGYCKYYGNLRHIWTNKPIINAMYLLLPVLSKIDEICTQHLHLKQPLNMLIKLIAGRFCIIKMLHQRLQYNNVKLLCLVSVKCGPTDQK